MSENAREARVQQLMASAVRERAGVPDLVQVVSDVGV